MRLLFFVLGFFIVSSSWGQDGYKIDFKIKGLKDTTTYLGHYKGENTFIRDTAKVNSQGVFFFDGKQTLGQGAYFLVMAKTRVFEFVVGADQHFALETSTEDYINYMKVVGDEDNKLFFENMRFNADRHKEAEPFVKILQDSTLKDESKKKEASEAFGKISKKVIAYQDDIISRYPNTVTAKIFKATKQIEIPEPPKKTDGSIDSTFQLRYYRQHFFDNFDLADDALTQMPKPWYQEKVKEYLEKLFLPQPDTITNAIKGIVAKAKRNPETYKYLVYTCLFLYQSPEIMGLDAVYVNIYDTYFASGEMDYWANASLKKSLKDHADKLRRAQIGKTAPNLMMQDQYLQPKSLYDIKKKYSIVFFFDPDCGHCRAETPKLVEFYNKSKGKYDFEIFAVASDTSMKKMRDFIKEMKMPWVTVNGPRSYLKEHYANLYFAETMPTIYILDDKKKVIARKLPVEKLEDFFSNYEKFQKKKTATATKGTPP